MSVHREGWSRIVLPLAVVHLLLRRKSHGYELVQRLDLAGFNGVGGGTLYPILHRLEAESAVEWVWEHPAAGPARKAYSLTPAGIVLADELTEDWRALTTHVDQFLANGRDAS